MVRISYKQRCTRPFSALSKPVPLPFPSPLLPEMGPFLLYTLMSGTNHCMRARAPLFDTAPFDLVGRPTQGGAACEVWALTPSGTIAMEASATLD